MPRPADKLWLPESHTNKQLTSLNRALTDYDERLRFGRNEDTGDWCAFLTMPNGQAPIPVIGFGKDLPEIPDMMARVRGADMVRYGDEITEEINRHNERLKQPARDKADDASWAVAEAQESYLMNQGQTRYRRIHNKATESRRTGGK